MTNQTKPQTPSGGPMGDTGNGRTGVPDNEQGISNRPGDRARGDRDDRADFQDDDDDRALEVLDDDSVDADV